MVRQFSFEINKLAQGNVNFPRENHRWKYKKNFITNR